MWSHRSSSPAEPEASVSGEANVSRMRPGFSCRADVFGPMAGVATPRLWRTRARVVLRPASARRTKAGISSPESSKAAWLHRFQAFVSGNSVVGAGKASGRTSLAAEGFRCLVGGEAQDRWRHRWGRPCNGSNPKQKRYMGRPGGERWSLIRWLGVKIYAMGTRWRVATPEDVEVSRGRPAFVRATDASLDTHPADTLNASVRA